MMSLQVRTASGFYPIYIGHGEYQSLPRYLQENNVQFDAPIVLISDTNVLAAGYGTQLQTILAVAGYQTHILDISPGDASKSLATCESLYYRLLDKGIRRNGVIIAVGGGVVGDLAGFVAATFERGIRFIQAPTTLLAHDSSIGGKVGINLTRGKNLVGAFYPPCFVIYDTATLQTLPLREWQNGMAEVIKHGLISDANLLNTLAAKPLATCKAADDFVPLLTEAMQVKVKIVEQDEHEAGVRMLLNLGHTIGHAVEQLSGYQIHHGEAVSIGICAEAKIATARGYLTASEAAWIEQRLLDHGLPTATPNISIERILESINFDKKHRGQSWTFALPVGVGHAKVVHDVSEAEVRLAYASAQGPMSR